MDDYVVRGKVLDPAGSPVTKVKVQAMDSDQQWFEDRNDDILGSTWTGVDGTFQISFSKERFRDRWLEGNPDVYLMVRNTLGEIIHTTEIRRGVKATDTKGLTFDVVLDSSEKKIAPPNDPYSGNIQRVIASFQALGGSTEIVPSDVARVFGLLIKTLSAWTVYTRESTWKTIEYDGPQVPRYPWRKGHTHKLGWEE